MRERFIDRDRQLEKRLNKREIVKDKEIERKNIDKVNNRERKY